MKLLVVARKFDPDFPDAIGGVIVSSENLLKYLDNSDISYNFVDTHKAKYKKKFYSLFGINFDIIKNIPFVAHIALNLNEKELILIAPLVVFIAGLFDKPVSLRVFGGNFDVFHNSGWFRKMIIDYVLSKCCLLFLQTEHLVGKYNKKYNVVHLPTCRYSDFEFSDRKYEKKFVFLGHIKRSKGVSVILDAISGLNNIQIDFYGPLQGFSENDLKTSCSKYCGVIKREDTVDILSRYDFLLFPTFYDGEGYPGVILESYAASTPVISTKWRSIPELVNEGETGFLIEAENEHELIDVISNIDKDKYLQMRENAYIKFKEFNCNEVYGMYLTKISECLA